MAWTTHGHHIPGTVKDDVMRPDRVGRCGGPKMCQKCQKEANLFAIRKVAASVQQACTRAAQKDFGHS